MTRKKTASRKDMRRPAKMTVVPDPPVTGSPSEMPHRIVVPESFLASHAETESPRPPRPLGQVEIKHPVLPNVPVCTGCGGDIFDTSDRKYAFSGMNAIVKERSGEVHEGEMTFCGKCTKQIVDTINAMRATSRAFAQADVG